MIKVRVDYATKSAKYPRFSKELDFNDEKHLQNFLEKANREGKKIIGHEIISNPCVWYVEYEFKNLENVPIGYVREYGKKYTIKEFQNAFNENLIDCKKGYIVFDNIK